MANVVVKEDHLTYGGVSYRAARAHDRVRPRSFRRPVGNLQARLKENQMLQGTRDYRRCLLPLLAAFVASIGSTGTAFALGDVCGNVTIKLTNSTSGQIKVTKFEYYDYGAKKWRTEVMFGIDGHQKLEPGKSWSKKQDLEHIENDKTKFKVTYQSLIGGSKWEDPVSKKTGDFTCKDGMTKEVVIDVSGTAAEQPSGERNILLIIADDIGVDMVGQPYVDYYNWTAQTDDDIIAPFVGVPKT